MTKYEEIIAGIKHSNAEQAEQMQEEIDILIHKLKFLPTDSFPNVAVMNQEDSFQITHNPTLAEKVKLAGGNLITGLSDDPQVIIILQKSDNLYQILPSYLTELKEMKIRALLENRVYIIQDSMFQIKESTYVQDTEILAEIIQPKYFHFGHDGIEFVKFNLK